MRHVDVVHVKLGNPPKGYRTIVFPDGLRERNMLVKAGDDWEIHVSIDNSKAPKRIFCLAVSPGGDEFKVTQMIQKKLPETLSFYGEGIPGDLSGSLLDTDQNEIISSVRDLFKE